MANSIYTKWLHNKKSAIEAVDLHVKNNVKSTYL